MARKLDPSQWLFGDTPIGIEIHLIANGAYSLLLADLNTLNAGSVLVLTAREAHPPIHQVWGS
jgi:hypothetical protein